MHIGRSVGAALKWMMAARFAGQLVTWVVTILVIRILGPDDYGLMALSMALIGFLSLFDEIGLGSAIVQRETLERRLLEQIFGLLLALDVTLYALIWAGAPAAAAFFDVPELTGILRAAGLVLVVNAFATLPDAMLSRRMEFRGKSVALFTAMVSGSLLTLALALRGLGVWSLVYGNLFMACVRVVVLQYYARALYRPRFELAGVGAAARFGGFVTLDRLLWYVYSQSDALIIGKLLGKEILGLYSVGMHLASLPMQKIAGMLNEIGFSAFSRLQSDPAGFRAHFVKAVRVLSLLAFPVFLGISSVAPEIVGIFLGDKWRGAVLPIQVLALVVPLRLLGTVLPSALYALGRADVSMRNNVLACVLLPASFAAGATWGLTGVCVAWVLAYPLWFAFALGRALPVIGVGAGELLRAVRAPLLSALVMYAAVSALRAVLERTGLAQPAVLLALVLAGVALYGVLALLLQRETCMDLVGLVGGERGEARVAALDPLAPVKAALPATFKDALRARWRRWHLDRAA